MASGEFAGVLKGLAVAAERGTLDGDDPLVVAMVARRIRELGSDARGDIRVWTQLILQEDTLVALITQSGVVAQVCATMPPEARVPVTRAARSASRIKVRRESAERWATLAEAHGADRVESLVAIRRAQPEGDERSSRRQEQRRTQVTKRAEGMGAVEGRGRRPWAEGKSVRARVERIKETVMSRSPDERRAFLLIPGASPTADEIAEQEGVSKATAKRARARAQKELATVVDYMTPLVVALGRGNADDVRLQRARVLRFHERVLGFPSDEELDGPL